MFERALKKDMRNPKNNTSHLKYANVKFKFLKKEENYLASYGFLMLKDYEKQRLPFIYNNGS